MELPTAKVVPGPGEHSPDYHKIKNQSPRFGFGSERRSNAEIERQKYKPGPGNYQIPGVIGKDGTSKTMHSSLPYSPAMKEQSYKPGPGNYDPDPLKTKNTEPKYKVGTSQRTDYEFDKKTKF